MNSISIVSVSIITTCLLSSCGQAQQGSTNQELNNTQIIYNSTTTSNNIKLANTLDNNDINLSVLTKNATYRTDHGKHEVNADFNISENPDWIIVDVTVTMLRGDHESWNYIRRFNSVARTQIVGKKISDLSISAIGWASDTTDAFLSMIESL